MLHTDDHGCTILHIHKWYYNQHNHEWGRNQQEVSGEEATSYEAILEAWKANEVRSLFRTAEEYLIWINQRLTRIQWVHRNSSNQIKERMYSAHSLQHIQTNKLS